MRDLDKESGCFLAWFAMVFVVALVMAGVFVWAVIALVNHFTA